MDLRFKAVGAVVAVKGSNAKACLECANFHASIQSLDAFYRELGLVPDRFMSWTRRYGVDSMGVSPEGEVLITGFPMFSSVAWMNVEPVTLAPEKLQELVDECKALIEKSENEDVKLEARSIQAVAEFAYLYEYSLWFGCR